MLQKLLKQHEWEETATFMDVHDHLLGIRGELKWLQTVNYLGFLQRRCWSWKHLDLGEVVILTIAFFFVSSENGDWENVDLNLEVR